MSSYHRIYHGRTKLKQTEVDCGYLKRCCENLAQENRRLQREVAELRAQRISTTAYPFFYGHLPAAGFSTARVCPSCNNKKATAHYTAISAPPAVVPPPSSVPTLFARPHLGPFTVHPVLHRHPSATSWYDAQNKALISVCVDVDTCTVNTYGVLVTSVQPWSKWL